MFPYTEVENSWLSKTTIKTNLKLINDRYFITLGVSTETLKSFIQYSILFGVIIVAITTPAILWFLKNQ